jgi:hypothetical protein
MAPARAGECEVKSRFCYRFGLGSATLLVGLNHADQCTRRGDGR